MSYQGIDGVCQFTVATTYGNDVVRVVCHRTGKGSSFESESLAESHLWCAIDITVDIDYLVDVVRSITFQIVGSLFRGIAIGTSDKFIRYKLDDWCCPIYRLV